MGQKLREAFPLPPLKPISLTWGEGEAFWVKFSSSSVRLTGEHAERLVRLVAKELDEMWREAQAGK